MKNVTKKVLAGVLAFTFIVAMAVSAAEPGTSDDPLISKSYLDGVVIPYINQMSSFAVVTLNPGQTIIGHAGCEMILRMGSATIIATEKGGICDTTLGGDLQNGTPVPSNHNLIVPVSDGRGITANSSVILMIKGTYSVY